MFTSHPFRGGRHGEIPGPDGRRSPHPWVQRQHPRVLPALCPALCAPLHASPGSAYSGAHPPVPAVPDARSPGLLVLLQQVVCALRVFSRQVLKKDWAVEQIPYQRTGRRLPEILSPQEVAALFLATPNLKHRALLMTLYAGGLRVSEVTPLRVTDIDGQRMVIRIEPGQGHQDRYVM